MSPVASRGRRPQGPPLLDRAPQPRPSPPRVAGVRPSGPPCRLWQPRCTPPRADPILCSDLCHLVAAVPEAGIRTPMYTAGLAGGARGPSSAAGFSMTPARAAALALQVPCPREVAAVYRERVGGHRPLPVRIK
jgi:hypothetical protein